MLLEPVDGLSVEVVGGLVEEQQVGRLEQQLAQRDAAALAAGEHVDDGVRRRALESVHRLVQAGVDVPCLVRVEEGLEVTHLGQQGVEVRVRLGHLVADLLEAGHLRLDLGHCLLDVLEHGLVLGQRGFLQQNADGGTLGQHGLAVVGLLDACHQLEQGGLAGAVGADDADLGAGIEGQGDVVKDHLVAHRLADVVHGVDELSHVECLSI